METNKRILCLLIGMIALIYSVSGQKKSEKDSIFGSNINAIIFKQLDDFDKDMKKLQNSDSIINIVHLVFYEYNLQKKRAVFSIVEIIGEKDLEKFPPKYRFGNSDIVAIVKFPNNCDSLKYVNIVKIDEPTLQYINSLFPSNIFVNGTPHAYIVKIKNKRIKIKKALCNSIDNINYYTKYNF